MELKPKNDTLTWYVNKIHGFFFLIFVNMDFLVLVLLYLDNGRTGVSLLNKARYSFTYKLTYRPSYITFLFLLVFL